MSRTLVIAAEAEDDITAASDWYEVQRRDLAQQFREELYRLAARLLDYPRLYRVLYGDVRQAPLRRFPYVILYCERGDEVVLLACFYCGRDPQAYKERF